MVLLYYIFYILVSIFVMWFSEEMYSFFSFLESLTGGALLL